MEYKDSMLPVLCNGKKKIFNGKYGKAFFNREYIFPILPYIFSNAH